MKVLVTATNYAKYCQAGKKILEDAGCEIRENPHGRPYTADELKAAVDEIDGVVAGVDTWNESIFQQASRLKVIARFGVGVDNIDLEAAREYGITVCNTPGVNSSAVAEQAAALILSLMRRIPEMNEAVRKGWWPRPMFHEMKSRTVGFLGFGAIAKNLAERLYGFHPNMIAYDKYPNQETAGQFGVRMVSQEEVLKNADIISIHLPATEETKNLICKNTLEQMKDGVLIINTARGNIVREDDMAAALKRGKTGGFGTDVFTEEPICIDSPLFGFSNYIATPHVSAETYENCETTSIVTAQAVLAVFQGKVPENQVI